MSQPLPIHSPTPPTPAPASFSTLGLSPALVTTVARLGYAEPTPIQAAAIPVAAAGSDLVARAETGTGKTAAFALPTIDRLFARGFVPARPHRPQVLVLVPTRELALQVGRAIGQYGGGARVRTATIFGGVSMGRQIQALQHGAHVVVATPGRLIDHVERRTIDLSAVEILILDEADRMLDVGFLPALRRLTGLLPRRRQTLLFSATMPMAVMGLAADMTREPRHIDVSARAVAPTVRHCVHPVADGRKTELLIKVLSDQPAGQALVFCKTKRGSDRVGRHLDGAGLQSAVIHGNKSQSARTRALDGFRAGRVRVLVATDIAARGLDIAELPLVVNYDLPLVAEDYIHRIGRTGRAGRAGRAVSLVSAEDGGLLRDIQRLLPGPIERVVVDGFDAPGHGHRPPAHARPVGRRTSFSPPGGRFRSRGSRPRRSGGRSPARSF
jgi:ATP-dependent RNA helicase RhlE